MFLNRLSQSALTQYFPRQVVDPILSFLHGMAGYGINVLVFRDEAPHQRILLLIGFSFTRGIRMSEVDAALSLNASSRPLN